MKTVALGLPGCWDTTDNTTDAIRDRDEGIAREGLIGPTVFELYYPVIAVGKSVSLVFVLVIECGRCLNKRATLYDPRETAGGRLPKPKDDTGGGAEKQSIFEQGIFCPSIVVDNGGTFDLVHGQKLEIALSGVLTFEVQRCPVRFGPAVAEIAVCHLNWDT
jgi:hypothetical protein